MRITGELIGADRVENYGKESTAYLDDPSFIKEVRDHFLLRGNEIIFNSLSTDDYPAYRTKFWNKKFAGLILYTRTFKLMGKSISRERIEYILKGI